MNIIDFLVIVNIAFNNGVQQGKRRLHSSQGDLGTRIRLYAVFHGFLKLNGLYS